MTDNKGCMRRVLEGNTSINRSRSSAATVFLLLGGFLLSIVALPAEELEISANREFDWQEGVLRVSMTARAADPSSVRPGFVHRAQGAIETAFLNALFESLLTLPVDSVDLVEDRVNENPVLASEIAALRELAIPGLPRPSPDLVSVEREYAVPIYPDFVRLFVNHSIPFRMEEVISWVPTTNFTGVIIYAADRLPHRGTGNHVFPLPALLPEIYDENLRPVLQQDMLIPEAVRSRGVVAYASDTNEERWRERVGVNPIRIMATQVYGIHPTDLIIPSEDADRLLVSEHNRDLLRNGRVLVILDDSVIHVEE
jgi:hypothetical protein